MDLTVHSNRPTVDRMVQTSAGRLAGKTALVTGATSNIGRAIALAFAAEGARVAVSGRNPDRGAAGRARSVPADLDGRADHSRELAELSTAILGGRIDILVNNAGIYPGPDT